MENTENLVDKVRNSERAQLHAENRLGKSEAALKSANFTISAETDELRNRMEKEHNHRKKLFEAQIKDLYHTIKENTRLFEQLNKKYNDATGDYVEILQKFRSKETETTTIENKLQKLIGKVIAAKNKITSLNANTPYRPGAVERTLADVLEDLRNV